MDFSFLAEGQARWWLAAPAVAAVAVYLLWRVQRAPVSPRVGTGRVLDAMDTVIGWPPEPTRLLNHRHRRALDLLRRSMPEYLIFAQVPVARFISVPTRLSYAEWLRRVGHVCVDLVVCDRASNVLAVVEVRETGRVQSDRSRKRQARIERVLRAAGVPLQVWDEAWLPDPVAVRKTLLPELEDMGDLGEPTIPMEPPPSNLFGTDAVGIPGLDMPEPPRSTWFDEADATRPAPLDSLPPSSASGAGGYAAAHRDPALQ